MISVTIPRWTLMVAAGFVALVVVMATQLDAQAAAPAKSPKPATPQGQESLAALRQQIDAAQQQINASNRALLQAMFERIKSIKRRRGLTPDQAKAFDDAFAVELARINRAQDQLDVARRRLAARAQPAPKKAKAPSPAPSPAPTSDLVKRIEALEFRVTALEMASKP